MFVICGSEELSTSDLHCLLCLKGGAKETPIIITQDKHTQLKTALLSRSLSSTSIFYIFLLVYPFILSWCGLKTDGGIYFTINWSERRVTLSLTSVAWKRMTSYSWRKELVVLTMTYLFIRLFRHCMNCVAVRGMLFLAWLVYVGGSGALGQSSLL